MNKGHHATVNGVFFRLEKESKSIHRSLKKSCQKIFGIKRGRPNSAAQVDVHILPLLDGGRSEALCQQCFAELCLCGKLLNEPFRTFSASITSSRSRTFARRTATALIPDLDGALRAGIVPLDVEVGGAEALPTLSR